MGLDEDIERAILEAVRVLEARKQRTPRKSSPADRLAEVLGGDPTLTRDFVATVKGLLARTLVSAKVAVTGGQWVGGGVGSVESAMLNLVNCAQREILWSIYSLGSEPRILFDTIEDRMATGVRVGAVINDLSSQPAWAIMRLEHWSKKFPHCCVRSFNGAPGALLHAKVMVADRWTMLLGSANVSRAGLVGNHEMALVVEGTIAEIVASRLDQLL